MTQVTAKRTLVKSPPELWSELSELDRLAGHLEPFGEIKITKLEPEHTVAWEGEQARGTVSIEPSGWGTKVTLTAEVAPEEQEVTAEPEPLAEEPDAEPEPQPAAEVEPEPEPVAEVEPEPVAVAQPKPEPAAPAQAERPRKAGILARLFGWAPRDEAGPEREEAPTEPPAPEAVAPEASDEPEARPPPGEPGPVPEPAVDPEPVVEPPRAAEPEPAATSHARSVLDDALEALGSAHHRPFSRG